MIYDRRFTVLATLALCTTTHAFSPLLSNKKERVVRMRRFADSKATFFERCSKTNAKGVEEKEALLDAKQFQTEPTESTPSQSSAYIQFAQNYPFANNILIATTKTAAADFLAQTVIAQTPVNELDLQRSLLFCLFGALYLGGFQYLYQVQIFKKLFDVDRFTRQTWSEKLKDKEGLQALAAQTILDLTVLTLIYLPTFYIFKASVFSGSNSPADWLASGLDSYQMNFVKDETDLIKVWLPADIACFSVPLYLRLPVRHIVSFVWTAYLSFARGGH